MKGVVGLNINNRNLVETFFSIFSVSLIVIHPVSLCGLSPSSQSILLASDRVYIKNLLDIVLVHATTVFLVMSPIHFRVFSIPKQVNDLKSDFHMKKTLAEKLISGKDGHS